MGAIEIKTLSFLLNYTWIISVGILILITALLSWLEKIAYQRLLPHLLKSPSFWNDALLYGLHAPFHLLIWFLTLSLVIPMVGAHFGFGMLLIQYTTPLRQIIFVVTIIWFCMRFTARSELNIKSRTRPSAWSFIHDRTTVRAIVQLVRVTVTLIGTLFILQSFGISINALLAFGGIGGIAVGFAAKDTLANFLGGMMIFWDRPFSVGDWVRSPDREIEGRIEHIGWRLTSITTIDRRPLYVPNGTFSTITVENPSRMLNQHIKAVVGLRYEDAAKIPDITRDIDMMLDAHPEIDSNQQYYARLNEFAASSLNIAIQVYTKTTDKVEYLSVQQDVLLKILEIVTKHGAECAFPTQTVHYSKSALNQATDNQVRDNQVRDNQATGAGERAVSNYSTKSESQSKVEHKKNPKSELTPA